MSTTDLRNPQISDNARACQLPAARSVSMTPREEEADESDSSSFSEDPARRLRHQFHNDVYSVMLLADCALLSLEDGNVDDARHQLVEIKSMVANSRTQVDELLALCRGRS